MRALHERLAAGDSDGRRPARRPGRLDLADPRQFVNWCAFTAYGRG